MRLFLKDSERRLDPAPVTTDDRTPLVIGIAAWSVALVVLLFAVGTVIPASETWLPWMCVIGIILGIVGLIYTRLRRR